MRVSNKQMASIVKGDLLRNAQLLLKSRERVATQKLINRPSDDPTGMGKVLDYRKTISSIDQYSNNATTAKNRTEFTGTLMETVFDLLDQAKQIASEQSVETTPESRQGAAQQVEGIYDQILGIANTKYGDAYLFAGHGTDTIPFPRDEVTTKAGSTLSGGESFNISSSSTDYYVWYNIGGSTDPEIAGRTAIPVSIASTDSADEVATATQSAIDGHADFSADVSGSEVTITSPALNGKAIQITDHNSGFSFQNATYNGDNGNVNIIVGEDAQVKINLTGDELFTGDPVAVTNGTNVFDDLKDLKDALEASPFVAPDVSILADNLMKGINQIQAAVIRQSITKSRLETTEIHWGKFRADFVNMLSKIEDADLATAIVELQTQETAYEVSLATAAKMLNKRSLIDFL